MSCYFCGRPSIATCSVKKEDVWIADPEEVEVGDFIQRLCDLRFYRVSRWRRVMPELSGSNDFYIADLEVGRFKVSQDFTAALPVLRRLKSPCGIEACDRHMRELDDNYYQCAEHWNLEVYSAA